MKKKPVAAKGCIRHACKGLMTVPFFFPCRLITLHLYYTFITDTHHLVNTIHPITRAAIHINDLSRFTQCQLHLLLGESPHHFSLQYICAVCLWHIIVGPWVTLNKDI